MVEEAGLNLRVRATRFAPDARANTILDQSPGPGEVVKVGQTIAVVLARSERREGETYSVAQPSPDAKNAESDSAEKTAGSADANTANKNASNKNSANADAGRRRERADRNANRNSNAAGNVNRANESNRPVNANRATPAPRPTPPAANGARPRTTNTNRP
jgi:beta-lactam-binding protein with PASTA domain